MTTPTEAPTLQTPQKNIDHIDVKENGRDTPHEAVARLNIRGVREEEDAITIEKGSKVYDEVLALLKKEKEFKNMVNLVEPKLKYNPSSITKEDASLLRSADVRAHGHTEKGGYVAHVQSIADKNFEFKDVIGKVDPQLQNDRESITKEDANALRSADVRLHSQTEKGSTVAEVQSIADKNEAAAVAV